MAKQMKKFRVGYSVKWNFNGILEVEAENADDAEKKAEEKLDEMAGNNEFDDVSNFKAEFDGADVLDTEEVRDYDEECRRARRIAACSGERLDGEAAAKEVAEAVVMCRAHPVVCMGDGLISFDYDNSFGPTATVDDVLERMNMRDWRMACDWFCKLMLRKGGLDPENFDWPTPFPKVMKVPEGEDPKADATDVVARVCVTFKVDDNTYGRILEIVDAEDTESEDDEEADGEEICTHCDTPIKYVIRKGKRIVVCPECGTINPLCNECEPDTKRCGECTISAMCEKLNELRTDAVKPEAGKMRFEVRESERVDVGVGPGISRYGVYDHEKHMFVLDLQKNFCPECADAMNEAVASGKDPGIAGNMWISLHKKELEWYE